MICLLFFCFVCLQIVIRPVKGETNITIEMDVPPEAEASGHCGKQKTNATTQQVLNASLTLTMILLEGSTLYRYTADQNATTKQGVPIK
jgi:hypothetical protein